MRQSKIANLIHHSAANPNLTHCSVEIHFHMVVDPPAGVSGDSEVVPQSQLVVSRSAYKNGSSKYHINGKESNYTEVTTLMKEKGIDLEHKRFLILQGEVESIAQMKPKAENDNDDGLLEYLEDIIGTAKYKKEIESSEKKLEEVNEDCTTKAGRLDVVKREMNSLASKKDEIVGYMILENRLAVKRSIYFQHSIKRLTNAIEEHTKSLDEDKKKLEDQKQSTEAHREEIESIEEKVKEGQKHLSDLKKQLSKASKNLSKTELEKVQFEEKSKHMQTQTKKLQKTITSATHALNEANTWITNYEDEAVELNQKLEDLNVNMKQKAKELAVVQNDLKGKTEPITAKIEIHKKELEPWSSKISDKESEIAVAQSQIDLLVERHTASKETLRNAKKEIERIMTEGQEKEQAVTDLKEEIVQVQENIEVGTREIANADVMLKKMKKAVGITRQKVQAAVDVKRNARSQGNVLNSLTKLSASGRVDGFHGRLGALGSIESKYDVAISTACPALDNLVVDTVEAGQICVDYLRKNNIGRGKFILLDKLPKKNMGPIETPENAPRLIDLVKMKNEKFRPAFYSVLGDTLVAKSPEQARRIAYGAKRWRVVSLQGVLIDKSGTMSGGGQVLKGKMKAELVETGMSDEELKSLEIELADSEAQLKEAEDEFYKMEQQLSELKESKPKLEMDLAKLNMDIENMSKLLQQSQSQYKATSSELKKNLPSQKEMDKQIAKKEKLEGELAEIRTHSSVIQDRIDKLQEEIMDIGGVKLRFIQSEIDGIISQKQIIAKRISNGNMEKTKKTNEVKKQQKLLSNAEKELERWNQDTESSGTGLHNINQRIAELEKEVDDFKTKVEEAEDALTALKTDQEERTTIINGFMSAAIEINNNIEQLEIKLKEDTRKLQNYQHKLRELKLHEIGDLVESSEDDEKAELVEYTSEHLAEFEISEIKRDMVKLEEKVKDSVIDLQVLKEYRRRHQEYLNRNQELEESVIERDTLKSTCQDLRKQRLDEFMTGFNIISLKLKELYQLITMGGNAELELVDSLDPFSEGILFSVMPPKKSWKNISNLSGGEKTLSSLALVFALHHYKPTPLYVMDEIDAALDFRNVSIVANYIKERTRNGQFIVISLRNDMFELANQLVGIYKVKGMTKSVALRNEDYIERVY